MTQEIQNKKYYCDTFLELHAPEALSRKVMNMTKQNNKKLTFVKKLAATAASLAALFVGSNVITYAATGEVWVSGFFKDVQRWDGAVIGTEYVTVPGEIDITAEQDTLTITLNNPAETPFVALDTLTLGDAILTPLGGDEISLTVDDFTASPITDDKVQITISDSLLQTGTSYILSIQSLYGSSKADAPLKLLGEWQVAFTFK